MSIFELEILWFTLAPSYYGLMYVLWFIGWYLIMKKRAVLTALQVEDLLLYIFVWVVAGWRAWYMLFYNFSSLVSDPLSLLKVWEGGMSFHWWFLWVIIALIYFAKKYKIPFYTLADELTLVAPIGLFFGRIGNYINAELLWFAGYYGPLHVNGQFPSPLLEALLEWLVLFAFLWWFKSLPLSGTPLAKGRKFIRYSGQISALFLIGYWIFRTFVEVFFRQPDAHIGYILPYISLGSLLSVPMIVIWVILFFRLQKK